MTAVRQAMSDGDLPQLEALLRAHPDLVRSDLLGQALALGQAAALHCLLRHGADPNGLAPGSSYLLMAVLERDVSLVRPLLEAGADPGWADRFGATPLMYAAARDDYEVLTALLAHGAGVHARDQDGETALMYAAARGALRTARGLLEAGADLRARNFDGLSVADRAYDPAMQHLLATWSHAAG